MIFNKQLNRHDPDNKISGDCYRTAIACVLNKKPEEVPHVFDFDEDGGWPSGADGNKAMDEYLKTLGLCLIRVPYTGGELEVILDSQSTLNPSSEFVLSGESKNGVNHCVVAARGKIIWDPSIDNSGIVGPCDDGYWWLEFIGVNMESEAWL